MQSSYLGGLSTADSDYRVNETRQFARMLGLKSKNTAVRSPVSNGMLLQESEERMDPGGGLRSFCEAAHAITVYIVGYYSALRPHEYNGGLSPNESENRYWKNSNSVASFC